MARKFPAFASILALSLPTGTSPPRVGGLRAPAGRGQARGLARLALAGADTKLVIASFDWPTGTCSPRKPVVSRDERPDNVAPRYPTLRRVNALPADYPLHPGMRRRIPG